MAAALRATLARVLCTRMRLCLCAVPCCGGRIRARRRGEWGLVAVRCQSRVVGAALPCSSTRDADRVCVASLASPPALTCLLRHHLRAGTEHFLIAFATTALPLLWVTRRACPHVHCCCFAEIVGEDEAAGRGFGTYTGVRWQLVACARRVASPRTTVALRVYHAALASLLLPTLLSRRCGVVAASLHALWLTCRSLCVVTSGPAHVHGLHHR